MNTKLLFDTYDINSDERIFYNDRECLCPYNGHIEDYDRGFICMEADVVDGYINGIYKEYYFKTNKLEIICEMEHNIQTGLNINFHENGRVRDISLAINNYFFDLYEYDEEGNLIYEDKWPDEPKFPFVTEQDLNKIQELRKKYNLSEINKEILIEGLNFNYEKYFRK